VGQVNWCCIRKTFEGARNAGAHSMNKRPSKSYKTAVIKAACNSWVPEGFRRFYPLFKQPLSEGFDT
jgi:hypothetical protein